MQEIGRVIEVFIPDNGDVMNSTNIGFKVKTKDEVLELEYPQDVENAKIMRGDLVLVTKKEVSGKTYIDIDLVDGDIDG